MEDQAAMRMEIKPTKIIRKSIYTFLQNYQHFTLMAALLAFPYSASVLLSQAFVPSSSLLFTVHNRLQSLFAAAGFPPSSEFFYVLNLKLSQTISSSIFSLPFTLSSLLIAKAYVIQSLNHHKPSFSSPSISSILSLHNPLILTYICNAFLILSANATAFSLLIFSFDFLHGFAPFSSPKFLLLFSAAGAVVYSVILANVLVICNLAMVTSGMEKFGGFMSILKACVMIRGRTSTALSLSLPVNLVLAAIEALFQYRVIRAYHFSGRLSSSLALEGLFIAYVYSILIVVDTIVSCVFFKSCKTSCLEEENGGGLANFKTLDHELP